MPHLSLKLKIVLGIAFAIILVAYQRSLPLTRTSEQQRFDSWLELREPTLSSPLESIPEKNRQSVDIPSLTLVLKDSNGEKKTYNVGPANGPGQAPNVLRLLDLIHESDIISISERSALDAGSADAEIKIADKDSSFVCRVNDAEIKNNLKALLLFRLFKEYSKVVPLQVPSNA